MGRDLKTIYNQLIAEKETLSALSVWSGATSMTGYQELLADVSNGARVAVWKLFLWIVAYSTWLHEILWDLKTKELDRKAREAQAANAYWWERVLKEFQYGYTLEWIGKKFQYEEIDEDARLIKFASIKDHKPVIVKVAKEDSNGEPMPLDNDSYGPEHTAVEAYIKARKPFGIPFVLVSEVADDLDFEIEVYYDGLGDFELIKNEVINAVIAAIKETGWNGRLYKSKVEDAVQVVKNVKDVVVIKLNGKHEASNNGEWQVIGRFYESYSGYIKIWGGNEFADITQEDDMKMVKNGNSVTFKFMPHV